MLERILGPLPFWAKRDHPFLRYELRNRGRGRRRWLVGFGLLLLIVLLLGVGFLVATQFLTQQLSPNITEGLNRILYVPVLVLQVGTMVAAFTLTTGAVGEAVRRQQWDNLRVTEMGAGLALRTRWAAVFYRLRPALILIIGARVLLILGILWDLTAFQGQYLDLLISGIVPQMSIPVSPDLDLGLAAGVLLLSFMLTAGILLPLTTVGLDAAFGLFLSTFVQQRTYSSLIQIALILIRLLIMAGLGYAVIQFLDGSLNASDGAAFALMFGFGALTDWGLYFLHLSSFGEVWAIVPFSIFLGLLLMLFSLLQALIANGLLHAAIRRAQSRG